VLKFNGAGWIVLGLLAQLAACSSPEPVSTADDQPTAPAKTAAFRQEWVPTAPGSGNFEVCLENEAADNGVNSLTLPVGMVFNSWGHLTGSLRTNLASDFTGAPGPGGDQYAVALTVPVHLTAAEPCLITTARVVTNNAARYKHESVPVSLHYRFTASGEYLDKDGEPFHEGKGAVAEAEQLGVLSGTPLADIAGTYHAVDRPL
jgi:hypothetical protein